MKLLKKIVRLRTLYILLGIALLLLFSTRFLPMQLSKQKVEKLFEHSPYQPESHFYQVEGRQVHYVSVGADTLPTVLFIHGSPGSWDAFAGFMADSSLLAKVRMVSVDRAGYGKTRGRALKKLPAQAALIQPILENKPSDKPVIVVGHSYGGGVAACMAMNYPEQVASAILVAPTLAPELQKQKWYNTAGSFFLFRWLMAGWLNSSNREMKPLARELEKIESRWTEVRMPVTLIQGENDVLVPFETVDFLKSQMKGDNLEVITREMNHFVPWEDPELIHDAVLRHLDLL